MESFQELLKCLNSDTRSPLDNWLYNAQDIELNEALKVLTSESSLKICKPQILKTYASFIKLLLKGYLIQTPDIMKNTDISVIKNHSLSCNYLTNTLTRILHSSIYKKTLKLLSVLFVISKSEDTNTYTPAGKIYTFQRKLMRIGTILNTHEKNLKKSVFFSFPLKNRYIHLKKKKNDSQTTVQLAKNCVWIMLMKGKIMNEQLGLWKWKSEIKRKEIFSFFQKFWTRQSRVLNLLRMIGINFYVRSLMAVEKRFCAWQELMVEYKVIDYQQMQLEKTFDNLESLIEVVSFLRLNSIFQEVKEKSRKMRTKQEKLVFFKSRVMNLEFIVQKSLKRVMSMWKRQKSLSKKRASPGNTLSVSTTTPPICPFQKEFNLTSAKKQAVRYCILRILSKLRNFWKLWGAEKLCDKDVSCSVESTLDLSNFILPYEKSQKLRLLIPHLFNIITYKKQSKYTYFNTWMQKAYKNVLSIVNLKIIIQQQALRKKAKKVFFSELVFACLHPLNFTDID